MFRFIAFFWTSADPVAGATARRLVAACHNQSAVWQVALDQDGFVVLTAGALAGGLSSIAIGAAGVVVGDLFRSSSMPSTRCSALSDAEHDRILRSKARDLTENYWGNYVALISDPNTQTRWVLRGPASTLPCLHRQIKGLDLYFSWTESVASLEEGEFSVNWKQVPRSLVGPMLSSQTGLNEVREILPGFCEEVSVKRHALHCYWDPVRIAQSVPFENFEHAAQALHAVTRACIQSWAATSGRVALGLSGGLDSSIVLGCLQHQTSDIVCFTHFSEGPDSDERPFARLAAKRGSYRHIELLRGADVDLRNALIKTRLERSPGMRASQLDRIEPEVAREAGAGAIFKGHGGDELFCRHHTQFYVADLLRARGLSSELFGSLLHSAVTEGANVWTILLRAIRDAYLPRRWNMTAIFREDQENQSLLHPDVLSELLYDRSFDSPFVTSTRDCPPGKLWQISLITGRRRHYGPWDREGDPQNIAPLLSQPIIETCLRIPTFMQTRGRRERAVARAAFTSEVPREILERRWKGGVEQLAWKMFQRNLPFIRALLLDGTLARQRLLDRPKLESALSGSPSSIVRATVPVFELIGMEAWLQSWSGKTIKSTR